MFYINTRNNYHPVKGSEAICLGMVPGGGLFVPEEIPFYFPDQEQLAAKDYLQLAEDIVGLYLDDFNKEEIRSMINGAYCRGNFDDGIAPLVQVGNKHILELWHGPTAAFKDMALQLLPRLLTASIAKNNKQMETVILVATSGDTGKAALEGFKNVDGIKIIVFYPAEGVSYIQERQMLVTDGDNTYVVAVEGNFDDCQSAVKAIFADPQLNQALAEHNKCFSSANSINWGRLLPQIVYYYDGYRQMMAQNEIKWGQKINIVVPTGNFGNILAAYYAKKMGLPINKLICASNKNNVLTDAINKGIYDRRRPFYKTTSPSMDILISSNFERFFFEMTGRNGAVCQAAFADLLTKGYFEDDSAYQAWKDIIWADYLSDEEAAAVIKENYNDYGYLLDPHTAIAVGVWDKYQKQHKEDTCSVLIDSTANPYKFPAAVLAALGEEIDSLTEPELTGKLSRLTGMPVHSGLLAVENKPICHNRRIKKEAMAEEVLKILGL